MDGYVKATITQAILTGLLVGFASYRYNVVLGEREELSTKMVQLKYDLDFEKFKVEQLQLIISGQQATIASYKENLTSCLKEYKMTTQDEFTGE